MAPDKLTDSTLKSILWNKMPVELQREAKEFTVSVQELLQRLLRVESVIAERKRRQQVKIHKEQNLELVKSNRQLLLLRRIPLR